LKKILTWAIPVQIEEAIIWTTLGTDVFSEIARLKEELENTKKALEEAQKAGMSLVELRTNLSAKIKAWEKIATAIEEGAKNLKGNAKVIAETEAKTIRDKIKEMKKLLE
jgi:predicted nuclease with TOPRIM domain